MEYHCSDCDMAVKGLMCAKCDAMLEPGQIEIEGKIVQVSKCPNDCGMIKSPQCCGHDMKVA